MKRTSKLLNFTVNQKTQPTPHNYIDAFTNPDVISVSNTYSFPYTYSNPNHSTSSDANTLSLAHAYTIKYPNSESPTTTLTPTPTPKPLSWYEQYGAWIASTVVTIRVATAYLYVRRIY